MSEEEKQKAEEEARIRNKSVREHIRNEIKLLYLEIVANQLNFSLLIRSHDESITTNVSEISSEEYETFLEQLGKDQRNTYRKIEQLIHKDTVLELPPKILLNTARDIAKTMSTTKGIVAEHAKQIFDEMFPKGWDKKE